MRAAADNPALGCPVSRHEVNVYRGLCDDGCVSSGLRFYDVHSKSRTLNVQHRKIMHIDLPDSELTYIGNCLIRDWELSHFLV